MICVSPLPYFPSGESQVMTSNSPLHNLIDVSWPRGASVFFPKWVVELQQPIQTTNPTVISFSTSKSSSHNARNATLPKLPVSSKFLSTNSKFRANGDAAL